MRPKSSRREGGFTLIELLIVLAIISVVSAIAIAQVVRARTAANESAAISSLRSIISGQIAYANSCGNGGYATALPILGQPALGSNVGFVSPDMTNAAVIQKSGYALTSGPSLTSSAGPLDCNGTATETGFYASAEPLTYAVTGHRSFAVNHSANIWVLPAATAPTEPFGAPATPLN